MFSPTPCTYRNNTIIIPIAVHVIPGGTRLVCPPFIVPSGDWTLVWNLVTITDPESPHAVFEPKTGIQAVLGAHHKLRPSKQISDTQWAASFSANCEATVEPFSYAVRYILPNPSGKRVLYDSTERKVITHDPTIVIAHDPVEPPTSGNPHPHGVNRTTET